MSKSKLLFTIFFCLFVFGFLCQKSSFAHTLESDGSIGAVVHIDPEDDPIIGEQATFYFDFKDKNDTFSLENCDCKVIIEVNNKNIFSQNLSSPSFSFVFPEKGMYKVSIQGKPLQNNEFQNFTLQYDLRVTREGQSKEITTSDTSSAVVHILALVAIFVLFLLILMKDRKKTLQIFLLFFLVTVLNSHLCHYIVHSHAEHSESLTHNEELNHFCVIPKEAATLYCEARPQLRAQIVELQRDF